MTKTQELAAQTLEDAQQDKRSEIKQAYRVGKYADLVYRGKTYAFPAEGKNQADLASLVSGGVTTVAWLDKDNEVGISSLDDLKAFSLALNDRAAALFTVKHEKLAMVDVVTTKKAVRDI